MKRKDVIVISIVLVITSAILPFLYVINKLYQELFLAVCQSIIFLIVSLFICGLICKKYNKKVEYYKKRATTDVLTNLKNRDKMKDDLSYHLNSKKQFFVIYTDFEKFKDINDYFGHDVGDRLLCYFAEYILNLENKNGWLRGYRIGGDEFVVIITGDKLEEKVKELIAVYGQRIVINDSLSIQVKINFGVAVCPQDATTAPELIKTAEQAMYLAKSGGDIIKYYRDVKKGKVG